MPHSRVSSGRNREPKAMNKRFTLWALELKNQVDENGVAITSKGPQEVAGKEKTLTAVS